MFMFGSPLPVLCSIHHPSRALVEQHQVSHTKERLLLWGDVTEQKAGASPMTSRQVRNRTSAAGARAIGLAANGKDGKIVPYAFTRRQPGARDVSIQIAYVRTLLHMHPDVHSVHI